MQMVNRKKCPCCSRGGVQVPGRLGPPLDVDANVSVMLLAKTAAVLLQASSMFLEVCKAREGFAKPAWGANGLLPKHVSSIFTTN